MDGKDSDEDREMAENIDGSDLIRAFIQNEKSKVDVRDSDDDIDGLNIINNFIAGQKLNDYLNAAVDNQENLEKNDLKNSDTKLYQENINPNSRYVRTTN